MLSLYDVIRGNAVAYMPLFVHAVEPLSRGSFKRLCTVNRSSEGSNKAAAESDTMYAWETFLLNVEGMTLQADMTDFIVISVQLHVNILTLNVLSSLPAFC